MGIFDWGRQRRAANPELSEKTRSAYAMIVALYRGKKKLGNIRPDEVELVGAVFDTLEGVGGDALIVLQVIRGGVSRHALPKEKREFADRFISNLEAQI
jgi:hypothetical protein